MIERVRSQRLAGDLDKKVEGDRQSRLAEDDDELLYYPDLERLLGRTKQTIADWVRRKIFPPGIDVTSQTKAWPRRVYRGWLRERMGRTDA